MTIYACPKCGADLQHAVYATYPPIPVWYCPKCEWRYEKREPLKRIPFELPKEKL